MGLAAVTLVSSCGVAPTGPRGPALDPQDARNRYYLLTAEPNCPPANCNAATGTGGFGETGSFAFSVVDSAAGDQSAINVNVLENEDLVFYNSSGALTVQIAPDPVTGDIILLASGQVVVMRTPVSFTGPRRGAVRSARTTCSTPAGR